VAGLFGREGAAFLAGGDAAGVLPVFFAVDPLEEGVEQEITAKNGEREKHRKRHWDLTRAHVNGESGHGKSKGGKAKKS
jgi:hypothetical protein